MIKFTTILHDKRKELDLSMLEYVLLDTVEKLSKPKFRAHRKTLADFVGMSRGGIIKAINRLIEKGLLVRVNDKQLAVTQKWIDETITSVNKVDSGVNKVNSKCQQSVQPTTNRTNELELKNKNIQKDFEIFWKAYPKKVMKLKAEKSFNKAIKIVSLEVILKGLKTSESVLRDDKQFIPNAQKWLDGGGWADEAKTTRKSTFKTFDQ
jgi:hypothetical protein